MNILASCYSWGTTSRNISNPALRQGGASLWRYIWGWRVSVYRDNLSCIARKQVYQLFVTVVGKSDCDVFPTRCRLPVLAYRQSDSCWRLLGLSRRPSYSQQDYWTAVSRYVSQ